MFKFYGAVKITASEAVSVEYVKKIWHNFTFTESCAELSACDTISITAEKYDLPTLAAEMEYAVRVTESEISHSVGDIFL